MKTAAQSGYERLRASDAEYVRAMDLCAEHRHFEALPMLERLGERYPSDPALLTQLGYSLIMTSIEPPEAEARKHQRARARRTLLAARNFGGGGELMDYYLSAIPEDGGEDALFSSRPEVNVAMREGEVAFARRDYKGAITAYMHAMEADPGLYSAVLFIGDAHFAGKEYALAAVWFERASRIDPGIETAFRYWGDALMHMGRMDEARLRFIDAIIAEPYNRRSWVGLVQWANANRLKIAVPDIQKPASPAAASPDGGKTAVPDKPDPAAMTDGLGGWALYPVVSEVWKSGKFKQNFPGDVTYRHTLREEREALEAVVNSARRGMETGAVKREHLAPGIAALLALEEAGMLEPYILVHLADAGISADYASYRKEKREILKRYLDTYVAPRLPSAAAAGSEAE